MQGAKKIGHFCFKALRGLMGLIGGVRLPWTPPAFRPLHIIIIMLFLIVLCRYQDLQSAHLTDLLPVNFLVFFFLSLFKAHGNMNEEGGGGQSERLPAGGQLV